MPHRQKSSLQGLGIILALIAIAGLISGTQASALRAEAADRPALQPQNNKYFFPLVLNTQVLNGRVTYNGASAAGQLIEIRYWNGSTFSTAASTTTNSSGRYSFQPGVLPQVGGGKEFYVRWQNPDSDIYTSYLIAWYCDYVDGTSPDTYTCSFDIGDVSLSQPAGGAAINLPYLFQWERRPVSSDSYQVEYNLVSGSNIDQLYTSPKLGYVGQWVMNTLPGNMATLTQYWWGVVVYGSNGYGESRLLRSVRFLDRSSPPLEGQQAEDLPGELVRDGDRDPQR